MSGTTLTDQERIAIDSFLAERWAEFVSHAADYLSSDEIDDLEEKLS